MGMREFGTLIREARGTMTGLRLSELTGVPSSKISKIETGNYKDIPDPDVLASFSRVLHIPVIQMLSVLGYAVDETSGQPVPDDPREQLIERVRRLPRTDGVQRGLDYVVGSMEREHGIARDEE